MDGAPAHRPVATFGPDRKLTYLAAVGAATAVAITVLTGDPAGRLLAAGVALVLALYVGTDVVFSPRLTATAEGVTVRSPLTRATVGWDDIEHIRADERTRLGLRATTLEIDAGAVLVVLSRRAVGADPHEVAALVNAFDPQPR